MKRKYIYVFLLVFGLLVVSYVHYQFNNNCKIVDILIINGTVITMDSNRTILESGTIVINDGAIVAVGASESLKSKFKAKETINVNGKIVMPGLINTHTHAAMVIFRGFADDLPTLEWLENYIWPAEAKYINAEVVRLGTLLAIAEMIRSGTTTFNDMYFFEDEVAKAAKEAGIRAVIGETLLDFPTPNKKTPQLGLKYTEMLIRKWRDDPLITVAVAPHAPYTCSPEVLIAAKNLSDKYNVPFHIHLSETKNEVNGIKKKYGLTPVEYLDNLGILGDNVIAAHCVHLTEKDIQLIVRRKVGVAHNPESNMKLASGVAPIPDLLSAGANIGLGTDGAASNNDLNMFEEMDTAAKLHKLFCHDPTVIDARTVVEMATIGGARILGLDEQIGSIEIGKRADVIIINTNNPHLVPLYDPYSQIAYTIDGADVETVIIEGKIVMRNHEILTISKEKIIQDVRVLSARIKEDSKK
jgi:5-methylthioadenosine/S-adenosylhomocysteine deaminase